MDKSLSGVDWQPPTPLEPKGDVQRLLLNKDRADLAYQSAREGYQSRPGGGSNFRNDGKFGSRLNTEARSTQRRAGKLSAVGVRDSTEIKTGAKHILNDKIEPEFKSPRFRQREMKRNQVPLSYQKNIGGSRATNRINSDYFPSDFSAMRVTSTPNPNNLTQMQMSSYLRNKNEEASIGGLSARRNISQEYRQALKDKSNAHMLK